MAKPKPQLTAEAFLAAMQSGVPLANRIVPVIDKLGSATPEDIRDELAINGIYATAENIVAKCAGLRQIGLIEHGGRRAVSREGDTQAAFKINPNAPRETGEVRAHIIGKMVDIRLHRRPTLLSKSLGPTTNGLRISVGYLADLIAALEMAKATGSESFVVGVGE